METIHFTHSGDKGSVYQEIIPQLESLLSPENELISNLANTAAVLKEAFGFFWVGFYLVRGEKLILGPFQGPLACTSIRYGKGVCGTAWKESKTMIVPDVDLFPGHIACSSLSRSEIVVPLFDSSKNVFAVLDIDSSEPNNFDAIDEKYLTMVATLICKTIK